MLALWIAVACLLCAADVRADTTLWDTEIDHSIKQNFAGSCQIRKETMPLGSIATTDASNEFMVQVHYPSKLEVRTMRQLPVTLTQSDKDLRDNAKRWDYTYETWGKQTHSRWEVPSNHPGQDKNNCINMTYLAATEKVISYYETFKTIKRAFYVIHARNAMIHPSGAVALSCGYFIGMEACENRWNYAKTWFDACQQAMQQHRWTWEHFWKPSPSLSPLSTVLNAGCADISNLGSPNKKDFNLTHHARVFTIPALWDYNYHHFIADSLARVSRNLRFLKTNPDIMIHIRAFEEYDEMYNRNEGFKRNAKRMRNEFFRLLGLDPSRVISGPVLADQVFVPRFLRCSYLLSNPSEIQLLAKQLLQAAHAELGLKKPPRLFSKPTSTSGSGGTATTATAAVGSGVGMSAENKTLIIQQRHTLYASDYRQWNDVATGTVVQAFRKWFPEHNIVVLSSADLSKRTSLAKELHLYSQADVLVGLHGAGLTNMMFMQTNSLIVEMVGRLVDVHMPVCGYYGPMAAATGHHHYIHSYDVKEKGGEELLPEKAAERAANFYQVIKGRKPDVPVLKIQHSLNVENE